MWGFLISFISSKSGKVFIIVITALCVCLFVQSWIHRTAMNEARDRYEKTIAEFRETERQKLDKAAEEQQKIVFEYTARIEEIQKQHEETIKQIQESKFVDAIEVPSLHFNVCPDSVQHQNGNSTGTVQKSGTGSDLVCYTRRELQSKVAESLVIAEECDKMTEKYRMLFRICGGMENDRK